MRSEPSISSTLSNINEHVYSVFVSTPLGSRLRNVGHGEVMVVHKGSNQLKLTTKSYTFRSPKQVELLTIVRTFYKTLKGYWYVLVLYYFTTVLMIHLLLITQNVSYVACSSTLANSTGEEGWWNQPSIELEFSIVQSARR
jgi:hypothetical protein